MKQRSLLLKILKRRKKKVYCFSLKPNNKSVLVKFANYRIFCCGIWHLNAIKNTKYYTNYQLIKLFSKD